MKTIKLIDFINMVIKEKHYPKKIKYDGIVFKSQVELANYLGITPSTLCQKIKRGTIDIERINT